MEELITVPEAIQRYGVSRRVLQVLAERQGLRFHKRVGQRANLIAPTDLERALGQRQPRGRPRKRPAPPGERA